MRDDIDDVLALTSGAANRAMLTGAGVPASAIDQELRRGHLTRVYPRSYLRPWDSNLPDAVERAALWSAWPAALSHLTAVRRWGALYDVPGLPERLIVEMDGDRYHSTPAQRERDRLRDAALAAIGWQTVRFSWARLTGDPDGCRREVLAILARRRPR